MVIGLTAGSAWSNDVAPGRSTLRFASCGINRSIGSSSWNRPSSNSSSAAQDVISLVLENAPKDVVDPQRDLRLLVSPSNTMHVHQIPADKDRGRESGKAVD